MTYEPADLVEVRAFGRTVGAVAPDPSSGAYVFAYDEEWQATRIELSPRHVPVAQRLFTFPQLSRETFLGLPPLLADSLPDRFGNRLVDAWMVRNGVRVEQITALDRLAYAADRAMGALTFHPPARDEESRPPSALQLADLVTTARAAINGHIGEEENVTEQALTDLLSVGTSAGGARAKAVVAFNPATGQLRSGQLGAPAGFSHWLCKLDGVDDAGTGLGAASGFGRIEYAYHLMAVAAGITMTMCRLLPEHDRAHFLTRRFDRTDDGERVHVLTLCGFAHLDFNQPRTHDYAQYLDVVDDLGLGPDALEQAFARAVFNVVAVNRDDHTKNLAFAMGADGMWSLAPAYDLTYAYRADSPWVAQHQMSVNGRFDDIGLADLRELADRFAVPSPDDLISRVFAAVDRWPEFADRAGVPEATAARIAVAHRSFRPS